MATKIQIENPTNIPELDAILTSISTQFGVDLSSVDYGNVTPFTTGSLNWDIALGIGGLPLGRIIEIFGDESTLKTSFCLAFIAQRQKWRKENGVNKRDLIVDLEHSLTTSFIEGFGIDLSQCIWQRPDSIEQALQLCVDLPKSGYIDTVLFDSVDAGQNERQQKRQIGEIDVGGISKEMNDALRRISKTAANTKTTYLFINQVKMNPGAGMFGNPRVTPGGRALQFYACLRIELMKRKPCADLPGATIIRGKIRKTKVSADYTEDIESAFIYGKGYDETYDLNELATGLGILRHSAGVTKVQWRGDSTMEPIGEGIEKGKEAGIAYIRDNPDVRRRLRETCLRAAGLKTALSDEEILKIIKEEKKEKINEDTSTRKNAS